MRSTPPTAAPFRTVPPAPHFDALLGETERAARVAVDTEADSYHHYHAKVCLIQLTVEGEHWIVDPLAEVDLSALIALLADKPLLLHGADYDLRMLRASFGFRPRAEVFDTMLAAQLLGYERLGLAALAEQLLGVALSKSGQKSDWSRRPLTPEQLRYAVDDTRFLPDLARRLHRDLQAAGRLAWFRESCAWMVDATARDAERDPDTIWRVKGSHELDEQGLNLLRAAWHWRDREARRADRPAFHILGNRELVELARWCSTHPGTGTAAFPRLPRSCRGKRLHDLDTALQHAARAPRPEWPSRRRHARSFREPALFKPMRQACARVAASLRLPPSTVAPRSALVNLAEQPPASVEEAAERGPLMRWQAEVLFPRLEALLLSKESPV